MTNCLMSSISSSPADVSLFEDEFLPPSGGSPSDDGGLDILDRNLLAAAKISALILRLLTHIHCYFML